MGPLEVRPCSLTMGNKNQYLTSLGRNSSFAIQSEPVPFQQVSRTGRSGDFASSSRPWASPPFQHSVMKQVHLGFDDDEEVPLDAFGEPILHRYPWTN
jgi:hypothetical protein